jgi:group I intron endonuclease
MLNSGVYGIFSKIDDRVYIGSAKNFKKRKKDHFDKLKFNCHGNKYLQNFVSKYGIENIDFKVLATCPSEYCIKLEQWFLNQYSNKFNIRLIAESNYGLKASEETKQKMSIKQKQRSKEIIDNNKNRIVSEETKSKMSEAGKNKVFTAEHKQNLKLAAQKRSKELSQKHKGDNNPSAKLDWDKVNYIRTSEKSVKNLATELSVSITTIYKIKNNQIWLA